VNTVAVVVDFRLALEVHDPAEVDSPIEEQSVCDECVADLVLLGTQIVLCLDLAAENWQSANLFVTDDVAAELGRDKSLNTGGDSGVDECGLLFVLGNS